VYGKLVAAFVCPALPADDCLLPVFFPTACIETGPLVISESPGPHRSPNSARHRRDLRHVLDGADHRVDGAQLWSRSFWAATTGISPAHGSTAVVTCLDDVPDSRSAVVIRAALLRQAANNPLATARLGNRRRVLHFGRATDGWTFFARILRRVPGNIRDTSADTARNRIHARLSGYAGQFTAGAANRDRRLSSHAGRLFFSRLRTLLPAQAIRKCPEPRLRASACNARVLDSHRHIVLSRPI